MVTSTLKPAGLRFAAALIWLPSAPARADTAAMTRYIAAYAAQHDFHGAVAVARDGKVVFQRSFGFANLPFKAPNKIESRFKIASITKLFTAVLILQLRDSGKLDVDKTIRTYLPSYAGPAGDKVTLHQLLHHTSGIDNLDKIKSAAEANEHGMPVYQMPHTSDQLVAQFCSGPLVHPPGTAFDYNNADYIILGKIIEQLYGKPYEQVLSQQILDPLRLRSTGVAHHADIIPGLADTYFVNDNHQLSTDLPVYPENWFAAGAMYSTVNDLLVFARALFGGQLVSSASLALLIAPGLDDYGYGAWTYDTTIHGKTYHLVKRPGRIMGAQGQLVHVMSPDLTIAILSNVGNSDLDEMVAEIGKRALE